MTATGARFRRASERHDCLASAPREAEHRGNLGGILAKERFQACESRARSATQGQTSGCDQAEARINSAPLGLTRRRNSDPRGAARRSKVLPTMHYLEGLAR